jgi:hypothetical protein
VQATHTGTILSVVRVHSVGVEQTKAEQFEHAMPPRLSESRDGSAVSK